MFERNAARDKIMANKRPEVEKSFCLRLIGPKLYEERN